MRILLGALTAILLLTLCSAMSPAGQAGPPDRPHRLHWKSIGFPADQHTGGLDAIDSRHAWVGGSEGGVWKTRNGGRTWKNVSPRKTRELDFRDVEATDFRHVQVLAVGEGAASRIYRTRNGGKTWKLTFFNRTPKAFYDCMAMWPGGKHGLAVSDPVNGKFRIIATHDRGASWHLVNSKGMPAAKPGEVGWATGSCLVTAGARQAWLGSVGSAARIFHTWNRGRTWTVRASTIPASEQGGVLSLSFRNPHRGLAVGGDFHEADIGLDMSAFTRNSGRSWWNGGDLGGLRTGVAWVYRARRMAIAVGPFGNEVTRDGGRTWRTFSHRNFDAVQCTPDGACWAVGGGGSVVRLVR